MCCTQQFAKNIQLTPDMPARKRVKASLVGDDDGPQDDVQVAPSDREVEASECSEQEGNFGSDVGDDDDDDGEALLLSSDELDERLGIAAEDGAKAGGSTGHARDRQRQQQEPSHAGTDATAAKSEQAAERMRQHAEDDHHNGGDGAAVLKGKKAKRVLSKDELLRMKEKAERRGVVYVSRIPPHMKPGKIRQLLSAYGEIGRLYCAPEDKAARQERKRKGKDTGKNFTEGWVEFEDKKVAKATAGLLNGKPIGGKRRSAYYYDLWCLKYLPKFKWDHLTEEINYQRAVREQRLAAEISSAKRERDFYLSRVDRAKAIEAIRERKKAKAEAAGGAAAAAAAAGAASVPAGAAAGSKLAAAPAAGAAAAAGALERAGEDRRPRAGRHFRQTRGRADVLDADAVAMADDVLALVGAGGRKRQ